MSDDKFLGHEMTASEMEANDRLRAAAPDLLKALKRITRIRPSCSDSAEHLDFCMWCEAREAIEKAEGRRA